MKNSGFFWNESIQYIRKLFHDKWKVNFCKQLTKYYSVVASDIGIGKEIWTV